MSTTMRGVQRAVLAAALALVAAPLVTSSTADAATEVTECPNPPTP